MKFKDDFEAIKGKLAQYICYSAAIVFVIGSYLDEAHRPKNTLEAVMFAGMGMFFIMLGLVARSLAVTKSQDMEKKH